MTNHLTDWFPPEVKPVRKGVYRTRRDDIGRGSSYWNGHRWSWQCPTARQAYKMRNDTLGASQGKWWRGLSKKPRSSK